MTLEESLHLLNLTKNASIDDIRYAYRYEIGEIQSDDLSESEATAKYERLVEAYQFLINWKLEQRTNDEEAETETRRFSDGQLQTYSLINVFLFGLIPFTLIVLYDTIGFLCALGLNLAAFPYTRWYFKNVAPNFLSLVFNVIRYAYKDPRFYRFLSLALNILIYNFFALRILLPVSILLLFFAGSTIVPYYILAKLKSAKVAAWNAMVYIPLAINLLVISNFIFTTSETKETLSYYNKTDYQGGGKYTRSGGGRTATAIIEFHNGKYEDYLGMRFYSSRKETLQNNFVTLTLKISWCGLTVVSDYDFFYDPRYTRTNSRY